jgi:myo-inositol 2-dehydrogenase/D-chiro-inositol 1-dehydrogenase
MTATISRDEGPRLVVWGLGRMGERHARNAMNSRKGQLVAVADIDPAAARDISASLNVPHFLDLAEMLSAIRPDGVIIATHASNHAEAIVTAARHGVHIFCEKPLAFDGLSAVAALEAAGEAGVHVQMGFQMRFDPDLRRMVAEVHAGNLGSIYQLRTTVRDAEGPPRDYLSRSGGYYRDTSPHCIDLGRWLLGEVEEVTATGVALSDGMYVDLGDVDNATIVTRFASGTLGTSNLSRVDGYGFDTAVEVLGRDGAIRVQGGRSDALEYWGRGGVTWTHVQDFLERFRIAYMEELDAFFDVLSGVGDGLAADGADGLASMRVAEAAAISDQRKSAVSIAEIPW